MLGKHSVLPAALFLFDGLPGMKEVVCCATMCSDLETLVIC